MKTLAELRELRDKVQKDMKKRDQESKAEIIVGMGTCGIAAGAREILKTILAEIEKRDLDVRVTQTGCIGMCEKEPLFDVKLPGKERITYGNLKPEDVQRIISEHIVNNKVVTDLVIARHRKEQ